MCHRFNIKASTDAVATFLDQFQLTLAPELFPTKDYYPLYDVLVMRLMDDDKWTIEPRSWGFLHKAWRPTEKVKTRKAFQRGKINARSETVDTTWPWKFAFPHQRCVILASSFYEPYIEGGDANYTLPNDEVFAIGGLWDHFEGDDGKGNHETIDSCVMLTTDANVLVESTRKGRMGQPMLLTDPEQIRRYCSLEVTEHRQIEDLCRPWPDDEMKCEIPQAA